MNEFDREIQAAVIKDKRDKIMHMRHKVQELKDKIKALEGRIRELEGKVRDKQRYKLLASVPTTEKLCEAVAQYFCEKPGRYIIGPLYNGVMPLFRDGYVMKNYRVAYKKGRFRFERLED